MANLIAIPLLVVLSVVQTAIVNRLPLLHGTADVMLLTISAWALNERVTSAWFWTILGGVLISFISATPYYVPLVGYLAVTAIARLLRRRIWQTPILAMFGVTFVGTFILHTLYAATLFVQGIPVDWRMSLNNITLPSLLLNMLLAVPVYAVISDLAEWVYPVELEI